MNSLIKEARARKQTLGFAESCTGGLLSARLAQHAGVSDIYQGSVVTYSYQAKTDLLGVSADTLNKYGAVSENVAIKMAIGARKALKCDWSVSITGIAGPSGGLPDKPVGTVWFAVCGPNFERSEKKLFKGNRLEIQNQSVEYATEFLLNSLTRR